MKPYVEAQIDINAPKEKIWDALTNPDMTAQYMFGCRVMTDWKPGSRVDWVGVHEGKEMTFVTGEALVYEPYATLSYSVIDPFAAYPKTPENHLTVTHTLTEKEGGIVTLTASQGDYTKVAEGEKRYGHGADEGWLQLLTSIKTLVE